MPRVLRILNRLIIGGPALNVSYLTKYMDDFETVLVIGGKDDHEEDATHLTTRMGIKPEYIPHMKRAINPLNDRIAYNEVKALIERYKPDIVHTHAAKAGLIGRMAAEACNVPVILHTFHGHVFHSYFNKLQTESFILIERYLAKKSSGIVAISKSQKDDLAHIYKICSEDKIEIIPLGLDIDKFMESQSEKRTAFRNRFFIQDDEIAIGIIGRLVPIKNHKLFVSAAEKLLAQTNKKIKFLIVGDGDMRELIEMEFQRKGISYSYYPEEQYPATAICTSWLTQIDEVLAGLDIVALTSHNEGTPLSLIEAQASGKPVVSTNVGGVSDVVVNGKVGFITAPDDAGEFAACLLKLVEDESLRAEMGAAGKDMVVNRYSYQRLVKDMSNYYFKLLEQVTH
jgi:glycosyltransferase involved in cell wall biosynthesis